MKNPLSTISTATTFALCLLTPQISMGQNNDANWRGQSVTEFTKAQNEKFEWRVVNDGVMGGLSKGNLDFTADETARFHGNLSLENNGGFSMIQSGKVDFNLSNDLGLLLSVKGDGRTYNARLATDAKYRGMEVSFSGKFETVAGEWTQVKVPFSDFKGSFRGTDLPNEKFDPSMVQRVAILLGDKKPGPFDLEVRWIRTYGKGQGDFTERKTKPTAEKKTAVAKGPKQIIPTAVSDGRFTTLKTALDAAGLTPFFQWDNPLTVFAPTDEAFSKLPKETLESLLKPENKQKLIDVLSYHVVTGDNKLADALKAGEIKTIEGSPLKVAFESGRVKVNKATLIDSDINCTDGVIHVIDTVLLPPSMQSKDVAAK